MFLEAPALRAVMVFLSMAQFACTSNSEITALSLSPGGYGPVKVGMSVSEASSLLGDILSPSHDLDGDEYFCHYVYAKSQGDILAIMVESGTITRFDVRDDSITTVEGITVGSTGSDIAKAYGDKVAIKPHKYTGPEGNYYVVSNSTDNGYVFEVIDDRVVEFRSGRFPSVEYVEGCL